MTRGSGTREREADALADTQGRGAEAPADRGQWCEKRQHNIQPEDKRNVARGGGAMRGGERQRWYRTTGVRRGPLSLKWKGAQALETDLDVDVDKNVQLSSAMR
jgi:hypothetical protein